MALQGHYSHEPVKWVADSDDVLTSTTVCAFVRHNACNFVCKNRGFFSVWRVVTKPRFGWCFDVSNYFVATVAQLVCVLIALLFLRYVVQRIYSISMNDIIK